MLMDDATIRWIKKLRLDDAHSQRLMRITCDVWWHYLQTKAPGVCGDTRCALAVLESLNCLSEPQKDRFAERFGALLFQIVVQEFHDQSLLSVSTEYQHDAHYFQRVDRSKNGVVVSMNALLECEMHFASARNAVRKARRPMGSLVSLVLSQHATRPEFVRQYRSAPKVFKCRQHEKKRSNGMFSCSECTRLKAGKLHFYDPMNAEYSAAQDTYTTLDAGRFKTASEVVRGDCLLFHEEGGVVVEAAVTRVEKHPGDRVVLHCGARKKEFAGNSQVYLCTLRRISENIALLKSAQAGRRSVVDTLRMSRPFKNTMRHRQRRGAHGRWHTTDIPKPVRIGHQSFEEYLMYQWCKRYYFATTDWCCGRNAASKSKAARQRERRSALTDHFGDPVKVATTVMYVEESSCAAPCAAPCAERYVTPYATVSSPVHV